LVRTNKKIVLIVGNGPEHIEVATLLEAFEGFSSEIEIHLVHIGKPSELPRFDFVSNYFALHAYDAPLGGAAVAHARRTDRGMVAFEDYIRREEPDMVITAADDDVTMGCALTAAWSGVPFAVIGAGARPDGKTSPEGVNRLVIEGIASLWFAESDECGKGLESRGIPEAKIHSLERTEEINRPKEIVSTIVDWMAADN